MMRDGQILLGEIWHTKANALGLPVLETIADGAMAINDQGVIVRLGSASTIRPLFPQASVQQFPLLVPGFVDTHVHAPQIDMIGAAGESLLGWLEKFTYPHEAAFASTQTARGSATRFVDELIRQGTTTACIFASSHVEATDHLFAECERRGVRAIIGKTSMDRNAPEELLVARDQDVAESRRLIEKWHGKNGLLYYAVTPRFAGSCSDDLLGALGKLHAEHPTTYLQTHFAESLEELAWTKTLFPLDEDYLAIYERHGLLGDRSILAHSIHVQERDLERIARTKTAVSHCPTSNLFLGSGLFPLELFRGSRVEVGLGTDVGAGTSFSLLTTAAEAYKVQRLRGKNVSPVELFFLATLGGARALRLEDRTGNFEEGKEADVVAINPASHRLLSQRWNAGGKPEERLSALLHLADDRAIAQVWVRGKPLQA